MFGVTGAGLTVVKYLSNDGKKARWNNDLWDRVSLILFRHDAIEIAVWLTCWLTAKYVATRTYIFLFYTVLSPLVVNIEDADESYSDGERSETYRKFERPIHECGGTKGIRSQQSVEGEIDCFRLWLWKVYADQTAAGETDLLENDVPLHYEFITVIPSLYLREYPWQYCFKKVLCIISQ